jgi:hypothetical protein
MTTVAGICVGVAVVVGGATYAMTRPAV